MAEMTVNTLVLGQEVYESWLYEPFDNVEYGKDLIRQQMVTKAACFNVTLSEPTFEDVTPDDQRVAPFVDQKEWPLGTRCIIGTCRITMMHGVFEAPADQRGAEFIASLSADALALLRHVTREAAAVYGKNLTDKECDALIAQRGPEVAEKVVRKIQDG